MAVAANGTLACRDACPPSHQPHSVLPRFITANTAAEQDDSPVHRVVGQGMPVTGCRSLQGSAPRPGGAIILPGVVEGRIAVDAAEQDEALTGTVIGQPCAVALYRQAQNHPPGCCRCGGAGRWLAGQQQAQGTQQRQPDDHASKGTG